MKHRASIAVVGALLGVAGCSLIVDTSGLSVEVGAGVPDATDVQVPDGGPADAGPADVGVDAPCEQDLLTDPKNCGRCGRDCLGGACSGGRCTPVAVVTGETEPVGLAVDDTFLYWGTVPGAIRKWRLDGTGSASTLRTFGSAGYLQHAAGVLYVATYRGSTIERVNPQTGGTMRIATCAGDCLGIAVDGDVWFTDRGVQSLRQVLPDGGAVSLVSGLDAPEGLAINATDIFIANEDANTIVRVPRSDPSANVVFQAVADPVSVAIDATEMWIVSQSPGTIYRRPLAGGPLEAMATGQTFPAGVLLTPDAAYWANLGSGSIMRLAR